MNLTRLERTLIQIARQNPPSDHVPLTFEKRIGAVLRAAVRPMDTWSLWSRLLWRAALSSIAIMLVSGAWTWWSARLGSADFSQEFEAAVVVMAEPADLSW